jgi:hypothetical protein
LRDRVSLVDVLSLVSVDTSSATLWANMRDKSWLQNTILSRLHGLRSTIICTTSKFSMGDMKALLGSPNEFYVNESLKLMLEDFCGNT